MKNRKLLAGTLATVLALGTLAGNAVLVSAEDDKTITVAASATPMRRSWSRRLPSLRKRDGNWTLPFLKIMYSQTW